MIVVGLVGERGREVREFIEEVLGPEGRARAVIVATPADDPPLMRLHGAWRATAIAEHFREQGRDVLLLMDSLTRFAQAQREIGLAAGEPPVSKVIPLRCFPSCPPSWSGQGTWGPAQLPLFTRCWWKGTTWMTRSPTLPGNSGRSSCAGPRDRG